MNKVEVEVELSEFYLFTILVKFDIALEKCRKECDIV